MMWREPPLLDVAAVRSYRCSFLTNLISDWPIKKGEKPKWSAILSPQNPIYPLNLRLFLIIFT
jgi:hypothetical protein